MTPGVNNSLTEKLRKAEGDAVDLASMKVEDVENKNLTERNDVRETIVEVLRKYIYFAEENGAVDNFSDEENFIIDHHAKKVPSLLRKVTG